uniref:Zinc finger protein 503 n=1 Tax=Cyclopterus lumpus TaxID=8103 RepID=A0A8C2XBF8_CYCLU
MITSPTVSVLRNCTNPALGERLLGGAGAVKIGPAYFSTTPSLLQTLLAKPVVSPIKYLQPLPSTPISPIELDAKKVHLLFWPKRCSQIGKPDPPSSSKLSSTKSGPLKMSDIGAEDKSSFKPYSKSSEKKDSSSSLSGDKTVSECLAPPASRSPPEDSSPAPCTSVSPLPSDRPKRETKEEKKESDSNKSSATDNNGSHRISGNTSDGSQHQENTSGSKDCYIRLSICNLIVLCSQLWTGGPLFPHISPVHTVFPHAHLLVFPILEVWRVPTQVTRSRSSPHGMTLDPTKSSSQLLSATSVSRPPTTHPLHGVHSSAPSFSGHPLYPYGFILPNDPLPHICNWVSANGPCDKRFSSSEELLGHLRTHTAFAGTEKFISGYPGSSSLANAAAAAAMACHMHMPHNGSPGSPGTLALRGPHHPLGLSSRYHPYSKSPMHTPGAPVPMPAATGAYYSPYALYGQRLTTASALGYQ